MITFEKEEFKEFDDWELQQLNSSMISVLAGVKEDSTEWKIKSQFYKDYVTFHRKLIKRKLQKLREDQDGIAASNIFE